MAGQTDFSDGRLIRSPSEGRRRITGEATVRERSPAMRPQPHALRVPKFAPPASPHDETAPGSGSTAIAETLNELTHRTPAAPPQIGDHPERPSLLTGSRQLNPGSQVKNVRLKQSVQQNEFRRQPPPTACHPLGITPGEWGWPTPPGARRLSPPVHQPPPPLSHQGSNVPLPPRASSGTGAQELAVRLVPRATAGEAEGAGEDEEGKQCLSYCS